MSKWKLMVGDNRKRMRELEDDSIDSIVTDPPYHLTSGKRGGSGVKSLNLKSPAGRSRIGTGFMGKSWDGGDIAFQARSWRQAYRVLKPGGYMLVFGGSRTFHRLAVALEGSSGGIIADDPVRKELYTEPMT